MSFVRLPSLALAPFFFAACGGGSITIGTNDDGGAPDADAAISPDAPSGTDASPDASPSDAQSNDATTNFDPSTLSGLALWLDASQGVTKTNNAVSAWADRTTNHNDASQATAAQQPTFAAAAINGLPAIHFNKDAQGVNVGGNMMSIADSTSLQWGTGDFYLVVVARFDNNVTTDGPERGEGLFFSKVASAQNIPGVFFVGGIPGAFASNPENGLCASLSTASGDFVTSTGVYDDDTPHAFAMQRTGTTLDLRVDGASASTSTSTGGNVSNVGTAVRFGSDANGGALRLDGDVAEMLAVKGTLAPADRTSLETYLKTKYGL